MSTAPPALAAFVLLTASVFAPFAFADAVRVDAVEGVLRVAASDLDRLFPPRRGSPSLSPPPWRELQMEYDIFGSGRSALRDNGHSDLPLNPNDFGLSSTSADSEAVDALRLASSVLLLLRGRPDAAHESVLGVEMSNLDEAELAAARPGETSWSADHPLSAISDMIHAALHRLEGNRAGEGGHAGYDNAKFWTAGGPKMLREPPQEEHSVRTALADRARRCAPGCVRRWGVVAPEGGAEHEIIAGGGRRRTVRVTGGAWDGFAFVDLCRRVHGGAGGDEEGNADNDLVPTEEELLETVDLQRFELMELLRFELKEAGLLGGTDKA